jgi:hypothetical protein
MIRMAIAVLAGALVVSGPVEAKKWNGDGAWSAGWLVEVCGSEELEDQLICIAYIRGIRAGAYMEAYGRDGDPTPKSFCLPDGVETEQVAQVYVKRVSEHPEDFKLPADVVVGSVISQTWPCR